MIGLTKKQIGEVVEANFYPLQMYKRHRAIAEAQLKGFVEWGFQICTDHQDSYAVGIGRIDCPWCRQDLLDEVKK